MSKIYKTQRGAYFTGIAIGFISGLMFGALFIHWLSS